MPSAGLAVGLDLLFHICLITGVEACQALGHLQAGIAQAGHHIDGIGLVDVARACATGDEVVGSDAEDGHLLRARHGQGIGFVLEQYHTFGGALARHGSMGLEVGLVAELVALETWSEDNILEYATCIAVEVGHGDSAVLHAFDDAVNLGLVARLHEVVAGNDSLDGAFLAAPVGHDDALVAPLIAQDGGEQAVALLGELAVELVVGRHHGPGVGLLHGNLEALEVDFAQGTLAHHLIDHRAVGLLRIDGEVLDAGADVLALDAAHVGCSDLARDNRIL